MKQKLWQHNTSHGKLYLTGSCMIEEITSWNKKVSVVQFHDHSLIRQCKYFQMFLSSFAPWEGNQVKQGQQMKSKKRDSTALGRLQQYRWVHSPPSCCSSRKDARKRCHCTVCTWKRSLLMCSVSILPYINEYGETIELVTSLPKHSPSLMNFPHPCSFLKRTFRSNLLIYELQLDIYWCWWAEFNVFCFERHLLSWLVRTFLHGFYICSNSSFQKPTEKSSVYFLQLNSNFGPCAIFPQFLYKPRLLT